MTSRRGRLARAAAIAAIAAIAALAACSTPGQRQAGSGSGGQCFYARNITSWAPAGRKVVNLRVNVSDYYQLTLLGDCPNIDWTQAIGLEHRGTEWICSGLDATVIAPQGTGGRPLRCTASSLRRLTREEVAALPPKEKP